MSISRSLVRRFDERKTSSKGVKQNRPAKSSRKIVEKNPQRKRDGDAFPGDGQREQGLRGRRHADREGADGEGEVQRRIGQGGRHAGWRGAAALSEGGADQLCRQQADGA